MFQMLIHQPLLRSLVVATVVFTAMALPPAHAAALPDKAVLAHALARPAQALTVIEPHLSTREAPVRVQYMGWPAEAVLDQLLGASAWRKPGVDVEFRALDGYVSRIPAERFTQYQAYWVVERVGHTSFTVDNLKQNEKAVSLGPYYLVWDNIKSPELVPEGGSFWPYQVAEIRVSENRLQALLPGQMIDRYKVAAADVQKHCLNCHQVNGFGGDKRPSNLAQEVRKLSDTAFIDWVMTPNRVKPGTTMPPLADAMLEADRVELANRLLDYLRTVPVMDPAATQ
ncbi:MAG: hypothetical protein K2W33_14245 [Burkholderiales bacterium]|nr:hypothetical protein [Burkholderiales bacterium]